MSGCRLSSAARVLGMVAAGAVAIVAAPALADWGHPVQWDQMSQGTDAYGAHSTVDNDRPMESITADDFLCTQTGPLTGIHFGGWSAYGNQYIDSFRITFWDDVPATPQDAGHPGNQLYSCDVAPVDPGDPFGIGWEDLADGTFRIRLPGDEWFYQQAGNIYWLSIQGVMVDDGFADTFYWNIEERHLPVWGADAAFASDYFGYTPWAHIGFPVLDGDAATPAFYEGAFPADWEASADMAFALSGVPEPATVSLLALGALVMLRRRGSRLA